MDNYSKILKSFSVQSELNTKIWKQDGDNVIMRPKVREKLLEIAYEFMVFLSDDVFVTDIIMTGSLANYNWSEYSDIDLHLIIDYSQFTEDQQEVVKELFKLKKTLFNSTHDIRVFNYEVELYAQSSAEVHFSTGVYSVLYDEWDVLPKKEPTEIDQKVLISKAENWMEKIDELIENSEDEDLELIMKEIDKLKTKIKEYRSIGLEKKGEYSYENLVFKFLRRSGYIQKLFDFENEVLDRRLSLIDSRKIQ